MIRSPAPLLATGLVLVALLTIATSRADTDGSFTCQLIAGDTAVAITDYPESATGKVVIPGKIAGKPVTSIAKWAFSPSHRSAKN